MLQALQIDEEIAHRGVAALGLLADGLAEDALEIARQAVRFEVERRRLNRKGEEHAVGRGFAFEGSPAAGQLVEDNAQREDVDPVIKRPIRSGGPVPRPPRYAGVPGRSPPHQRFPRSGEVRPAAPRAARAGPARP